jgi:hypothetical protein
MARPGVAAHTRFMLHLPLDSSRNFPLGDEDRVAGRDRLRSSFGMDIHSAERVRVTCAIREPSSLHAHDPIRRASPRRNPGRRLRWLEEITGERAMDWVLRRKAESADASSP